MFNCGNGKNTRRRQRRKERETEEERKALCHQGMVEGLGWTPSAAGLVAPPAK